MSLSGPLAATFLKGFLLGKAGRRLGSSLTGLGLAVGTNAGGLVVVVVVVGASVVVVVEVVVVVASVVIVMAGLGLGVGAKLGNCSSSISFWDKSG